MYQSASNNQVLAEIWAEVMAMEYGAVLEEVAGFVLERAAGWDPDFYAPADDEEGPRALLAAFRAVEGGRLTDDRVIAVKSDISHDLMNLESNLARGYVLSWYPRTMRRFVVEETPA